jgi:CheY-like chemotaxis protein
MTESIENLNKVCIIDDDEIYHFTIQKTIKLQGFNNDLLYFHNGHEAIDFFNQNLENTAELPDVILLDLNMPVINGWQFLQEYATFKDQIKKPISIYVVSSSISRSEISRATAIEDVLGYIQKPLKPEELKRILVDHNVN